MASSSLRCFLRREPLKFRTRRAKHGKGREVKRKKDRERKRKRERNSKLQVIEKSPHPFLDFFVSRRTLSPLSWTRRRISVGKNSLVEMHFFDRMTIPMRRVWTGVATRLGVRKSGLLKLRKDVRSCEYEDVHVMWEMLRRNETEVGRSPRRCKKRPLSNCFEWARRAPFLCRGF
ncbi:PREDICTED: uncharacterized protein LOC18592002 [Theobroma cacao]|uniref:Uncharacterized protein LOC18592002 n=1 Tax=Theobroma cacao TaxID=3641 RepID=A0AB32UVD5_THECC|nr:PREDICTED: uncharacterized protein LOC18592002 [Theobroma cacao]